MGGEMSMHILLANARPKPLDSFALGCIGFAPIFRTKEEAEMYAQKHGCESARIAPITNSLEKNNGN
jgi:hypothetical protein